MNQFRNIVLATALLLGLGQCQKKADPSPADLLPPATQTGANTFGCLVNGQLWTPKGYNGTSNYSIDYESGIQGGRLDVQAYRYPDKSNKLQTIAVISGSVSKPGAYSLKTKEIILFDYADYLSGCTWSSDKSTTTYRRGTLIVTRLDLQAGIVSGTFDFTMYKPGCDSVRVTQGRFDYRF